MKAQIYIALITMIAVIFCSISSSVRAQNTGEILVIPENAEEVISSDGVKFSEDGTVTFPTGTKIKVDFDLKSDEDSNQNDDNNEDKK